MVGAFSRGKRAGPGAPPPQVSERDTTIYGYRLRFWVMSVVEALQDATKPQNNQGTEGDYGKEKQNVILCLLIYRLPVHAKMCRTP